MQCRFFIHRSLCDICQSGKLNKEQFALSMWLIKQTMKGIDPPTSLTPEMVPPSLRKISDAVVVRKFNTFPFNFSPTTFRTQKKNPRPFFWYFNTNFRKKKTIPKPRTSFPKSWKTFSSVIFQELSFPSHFYLSWIIFEEFKFSWKYKRNLHLFSRDFTFCSVKIYQRSSSSPVSIPQR